MCLTGRDRFEKIALRYLGLGLVGVVLYTCTPLPQKSSDSSAVSVEEVLRLEPKDGDLICRLGSAWYSSYMSHLVSDAKRFSHIGFLFRSPESRQWVVYHAEEDAARGYDGVVLESLESFLSSAKSVGVYRLELTTNEVRRIRKQLHNWQSLGMTFDETFCDEDPSTIYCTELVAHVLQGETDYKPKPSMCMPLGKAYSLDDVTLDIGAKELTVVAR